VREALGFLATEVTDDPNAEAWIVPAAEATDNPNAEAWVVLAAEATVSHIDGSIAGVSRSSRSPESTVPKEY
jgi:hypothetical protein